MSELKKNKIMFHCSECDYKIELYENHHAMHNYCPMCGNPSPDHKNFLKEYINKVSFSSVFDEAIQLFFKNEYSSAARASTIIFENEIKKILDDDSKFGAALMAHAFSFKYDEQAKRMTTPPLIAINDLSSKTKRNEQDGMMHLCMGLMKGWRNIFAHSTGTSHLMKSLNIMAICNFLLNEIKNTSVAEDLAGEGVVILTDEHLAGIIHFEYDEERKLMSQVSDLIPIKE